MGTITLIAVCLLLVLIDSSTTNVANAFRLASSTSKSSKSAILTTSGYTIQQLQRIQQQIQPKQNYFSQRITKKIPEQSSTSLSLVPSSSSSSSSKLLYIALRSSSPLSRTTRTRTTSSSTTQFNLLLDVPDSFFTITFPVLGILLSISKKYGRIRMEELAWEQRLYEQRIETIRADPTVTEIELRRREAAMEWSAYGTPRLVVEQQQQQQKFENERFQQPNDDDRSRQRKRRGGVRVLDRDGDDDDDEEELRQQQQQRRNQRMSDIEIEVFEKEYSIQYDPYYDEPYTEDELPTDIKFTVDKLYGDRIYENGEIFYRDDNDRTLYWRQGSKPRSYNNNNNIFFWKK